MRNLTIFLATCLLHGILVAPLLANTETLPSVIEQFVQKQFPEARSHFWVVNQTELASQEEIVVDLNTITQTIPTDFPSENRFLLLIVSGKLKASQHIPLGDKVHCQPEKETI